MGNPFLHFTPSEVSLLRRLLFAKDFTPGTKTHIARFLDGHHASTLTKDFVEKMIDLSCLTYLEARKVLCGRRMEELPVYDRDRKRMKQVWRQTEEYKLSEEIVEEDNLVL